MAGIVLTDASPLIGLSIIDGLPWLKTLFGEVWMPEEVKREVLPGSGFPGEDAILKSMVEGYLRLWTQPVDGPPLPDLDEGESACIRIALLDRDQSLLLMDEGAGRALATELGLRVAGTGAVIGMAKSYGLIGSARKAFELLHQSDFRISADVIRTVLAREGEQVPGA